MLIIRTLALSALLACAGCSSLPANGGSRFSFGVWGDMPYAKAGDAPKIPALLASINASDIAFSIYDGDIKDGSSVCEDKTFSDAITMFNTLRQPTVYVPGDNEWTDCHRKNNGGFDNLERLAQLRKLMFAQTTSFGQATLPLTHQAPVGQPYVENTRFTHQGIVFVNLNIPGSNNNLVLSDKECKNKSARTSAQCEAGNNEYLARDDANVKWLKEAFELARSSHAPGLVMTFQADPGFDLPETEEADESTDLRFSGYRRFMAEVVAETEKFDGQVLLVHGDTHFFKVDMPLYSPTRLLPNLTRLQTFGSPSIHWVKVKVDPASPRVFSVEPVIVK
jgi:hypothetical protein